MKIQKTYSIGEASAMTGVTQRQLRNWEGKYIPEPIRMTVGGRHFRRYTADDIHLLKKIRENIEKGFTLPAAAQKAAMSIEAQKEESND